MLSSDVIDISKGKITLRLFQKADPEKTYGVKLTMDLVALFIIRKAPNTRIIRTNIEPLIPLKTIDLQKPIST